jgi:nitrogen fixation NifU-like protein
MAELNELYQQVILDHNKKPRNFKVLDTATRQQEGYNPLCGDQLTLYLEMDGETIKDVGFQGQGCAISKASASMMTTGRQGQDEGRGRTPL